MKPKPVGSHKQRNDIKLLKTLKMSLGIEEVGFLGITKGSQKY